MEKAQDSADATDHPPVDIILYIDAQYRKRAEAGELKTIAPRRFNPKAQSWLPIMHTALGKE